MKFTVLFLLIFAAAFVSAQNATTATSKSQIAAAESMQRNLDRIQQNGELAHPKPLTTVFTEEEVNAYVASGRVKLPKGVQSVRFTGTPGVVNALTHVDFDQLTAGQRSSNPLLGMFTGVHDVTVIAHASGVDGQGKVHVDSVQLDGVEIPQFVLQLFVSHYLKPKYPNLGIDSTFQLPAKVKTATVGEHKLTVEQ